MKVQLLGTGTSQGVPVIGCSCAVCTSTDTKDKRLRCSVLIELDNGFTFVIDTGPDFRYQMLRAKAKRLDAVIFTHHHIDHTGGLDDIRPFNFLQKKPMDIYATLAVQKSLIKTYDYVFAKNSYPGIPKVNLNTINKQSFFLGETEITPIQVWHHTLPVLGFRINEFTYITDANRVEPEELQKAKGSKVLVLNALRKEDHISHFNLQQAIEAAKATNVEQVYFTHVSHQMGLHQQVNQSLPKGMHLAYDELTFKL